LKATSDGLGEFSGRTALRFDILTLISYPLL
jgi:hypothetical protein